MIFVNIVSSIIVVVYLGSFIYQLITASCTVEDRINKLAKRYYAILDECKKAAEQGHYQTCTAVPYDLHKHLRLQGLVVDGDYISWYSDKGNFASELHKLADKHQTLMEGMLSAKIENLGKERLK